MRSLLALNRGTSFRFAPDPPTGGDGGKAAAPAGGGSPPPAAGGDVPPAKPDGSSAAPPAEDWQKKYGELDARYKQYERFGKPEDIDAFARQAQTNKQQLDKILTDFQSGKLTYAQAAAAADKVADKPSDPFDGYDVLEPREQAQRMMSVMRKEFEDFTKSELAKIQQTVSTTSSNLSTQMQLAWELLQTARDNPELSLDEVISGSTAVAGYSPKEIIKMQVHHLTEEKRIKSAVDAAVAKAKAEWQREADTKKVPPTTRSMPRMIAQKKENTVGERRAKIQDNFMERLRRAAGGE